ncbi:MAG: phytoene/squalene synthase family protein [Bacteroidetes bacterium]|nr:phytoene/squalene synthase family protein [Bacteroidota bacterium]
MKEIYDNISRKTSKITTTTYSTSFSLGIRFFNPKYHDPIYAIYGFVRLADEIVDTFHQYDKRKLLDKFREDTYEAISDGISMNPILNSFQWAVNRYNIERQLIDQFLHSMEMDLGLEDHDRDSYDEYILGSAEVVGLMCLRVFTDGNDEYYESLKQPAMRLGAAFQKINFLRDIKNDHMSLGRSYFPEVDIFNFSDEQKKEIELEIESDFRAGLEGIKKLPFGARYGVYLAYVYYYKLFRKIRRVKAEKVMQKRVRIPNPVKYSMILSSYLRHRIGIL